jgi:hypothetical protein
LPPVDRYPVPAKVHNGFITWKPKVVVITSNFPPEQWWNISPDDKNFKGFMRRITKIEQIGI